MVLGAQYAYYRMRLRGLEASRMVKARRFFGVLALNLFFTRVYAKVATETPMQSAQERNLIEEARHMRVKLRLASREGIEDCRSYYNARHMSEKYGQRGLVVAEEKQ